jgi:hypothetical protein
MAGDSRGLRRTRSVRPAHVLDVHASQPWWWSPQLRTEPFICVHGRPVVLAATASGFELAWTGLNETETKTARPAPSRLRKEVLVS